MFAPPVAKPKSAPPQRSAVAAQRPGQAAAGQGQQFQRTISNQAMLLALAQRASVIRNAPGAHENEDNAARIIGREAAPSGDFSKIPVFSSSRAERLQRPPIFPAPRLPGFIRAKLKVGTVNDPPEHEADRVADQVMRMPEPDVSIGTAQPQISRIQPRLRAGATGDPLEWEGTAPSPDSFRGRGDPLRAPVRRFFEQQLDYDFGGVHVHHNPDAADSARSIGARAYTYGRDIVFGAGEYSPGSKQTTKLLAHELAHVVQQGAGRNLVQRSLLSDSVKAAWTAEPKIEALLARLSQSDMQTDAAHNDKDIDTEIGRLPGARPNDLLVAKQIWQGKLGDTTGKRNPTKKPQPIKAHFFRGSTDRRALVIAGVHGSEKQGIEVAELLIKALQPPAPPPALTTIIVPSLFPDNAALTGDTAREGSTPTNRNFPPASEDLAAAKTRGSGTALDQQGRAILPENLLLIELMERFHPERIISIHGTQAPGQAGVFYDRRSPSEEEDRTARELAKGIAGGQELPPALQERLRRQRLAAISAQAEQTDRDLSLRAASQIDAATTAIKGREGRGMKREGEPLTDADKKARQAHPSIAGNVGPTGAIENATWAGGVPGGVSLGSYAPPRGMSVFTVEPPVDAPSAKYPRSAKDPNATDEISGAVDKLTQADRITELKSYADAVRTVLLGP